MSKSEVKPTTTKQIIKEYNSLPADISQVEWVLYGEYDSLKKENERLKGRVVKLGKERDKYAQAMKIALQEGIFFDKNSCANRIAEALKEDGNESR